MAAAVMAYPITLHHIYSSPEHNYFTRPRYEIGDAPRIDHESVRLDPGSGIPGDRFYRSRYPVTFFSSEVCDAVSEAQGVRIDPALFGRNIIVSGVNLCELIGETFAIGDIRFEGLSHCAPCTWMDAAIGKGTYALMRGRGGLRAKVLQGGTLRRGENRLTCAKTLERDPVEPMPLRRLP